MRLRGVLYHIYQFIVGTSAERRYTVWYVLMKLRGIDLRPVSIEQLGLQPERANWYSNSGGPELDAVLKRSSISNRDAALDIGCGKGGAILTMAKYPFARVDGIEISPELVKIAERNLSQAGVTAASIFCCNAAEFKDFNQYTFLYLYNPFPETIFEQVMSNILLSIRERPRSMTLIYRNPVCDHLIVNKSSPFSRTGEFMGDLHPYYVYKNISDNGTNQ